MAEEQHGRPTDPDSIREYNDSAAEGPASESQPMVEYDPEAPQETYDVAEPSVTDDTVAVEDDWYRAQEELEARLGGPEAFTASLSAEQQDYRGRGDLISTCALLFLHVLAPSTIHAAPMLTFS